MGVHGMIKHAQNQGVTLRKAMDTAPVVPVVLALPMADGSLSVARRNTSGVGCSWCQSPRTPAPVVFPGEGGWDAHMCQHHAYVYAVHVPVYGR